MVFMFLALAAAAAGQQPTTPTPGTSTNDVQSNAGNTTEGPINHNGKIQPPVLVYSPPPVYSIEARQAHFSGTVLVFLQIDVNGNPSHIRVVKGVGMGLDEKAVNAVRQYKFKPAMQDGKPVVFDLNVNVNFQIN